MKHIFAIAFLILSFASCTYGQNDTTQFESSYEFGFILAGNYLIPRVLQSNADIPELSYEVNPIEASLAPGTGRTYGLLFQIHLSERLCLFTSPSVSLVNYQVSYLLDDGLWHTDLYGTGLFELPIQIQLKKNLGHFNMLYGAGGSFKTTKRAISAVNWENFGALDLSLSIEKPYEQISVGSQFRYSHGLSINSPSSFQGTTNRLQIHMFYLGLYIKA